MESTLETQYGTVVIRNAMLDTDGTNLADGIEIKLDGVLIGEVIGQRFDKDDYEEEEAIAKAEYLIETYCENY
jgi:hypothetical protein